MLSEDEFICCQNESDLYSLIEGNRFAPHPVPMPNERTVINRQRLDLSLSSSSGKYGSTDNNPQHWPTIKFKPAPPSTKKVAHIEIETVAIINHEQYESKNNTPTDKQLPSTKSDDPLDDQRINNEGDETRKDV
jgi:hypothetical protein